jgi:predicted secreted Zn-dependent protease
VNLRRIGVAAFVAAGVTAAHECAAQAVLWKTNYFHVKGTNFGEIRQSIAQSKPWKENYDGFTDWSVKWQFKLTSVNGQCRTGGFGTITHITFTLPWWTTPDAADDRTKERWRNFYVGLFEHEMGHARIALAAAAELNRQYGSGTVSGDCATLNQTVNAGANAILNRYRQQEKEYDRRTSHGSQPARPQ